MAPRGHPVADELYDVPPGDFVRARQELVARLRERGNVREAAEVARLRRPGPALWTVNQLARRHPDLVRRFVDAVERLKRAQLREPDEMAASTREHRAATDALMTRARELLHATETRASPAVLGRISATLSGAAAGGDLRAQLLAGRLQEEHQAAGFDVFAGVTASAPARPAPRRKQAAPEPERHAGPSARQLRSDLEVADRDARRQARRARDLDREASRLERAAARAEAGRERARRALQTAEGRAAQAHEAARRARQVADETRREAERADSRAREIRTALSRD